MQRGWIAVGLCIFALAVMLERNVDSGEQDKVTIKFVMQKAMKGGLASKVVNGKADAKEKTQLVELLTALSMRTPPKGDAANWKLMTGALLDAAKADDTTALKKAMNCDACHNQHKK